MPTRRDWDRRGPAPSWRGHQLHRHPNGELGAINPKSADSLLGESAAEPHPTSPARTPTRRARSGRSRRVHHDWPLCWSRLISSCDSGRVRSRGCVLPGPLPACTRLASQNCNCIPGGPARAGCRCARCTASRAYTGQTAQSTLCPSSFRARNFFAYIRSHTISFAKTRINGTEPVTSQKSSSARNQ